MYQSRVSGSTHQDGIKLVRRFGGYTPICIFHPRDEMKRELEETGRTARLWYWPALCARKMSSNLQCSASNILQGQWAILELKFPVRKPKCIKKLNTCSMGSILHSL